MTPAELVAQRTWILLDRAKALRAPFGEESLTDLLVLEMLGHQRARGFSLQPTTKQQEASCGADLLVAVRHGTGWPATTILAPGNSNYWRWTNPLRAKGALAPLRSTAPAAGSAWP